MDLVSIIIPVYNAEKHLAQAITSALAQTWPRIEVIVVNDGSSDGSLAVAKSFNRNELIIIDQPNRGASAARNAGLRRARGQWIQFLDADDFLHPDKIKTQLSLLTSPEEIALCNTVHFHETDASDGKPDDDSFFELYLDDPLRFLIKLYGGFDYRAGMVQPNAYLTPRYLIDKTGGWDETLSLDDDGEFFCRVLLAAKKLRYVPQPLNFYRKYNIAASLSASKTDTAYRSQFQSICLKHQHLMAANTNRELERNINTATLKHAKLLMHSLFPYHKGLQKEVAAFAESLEGNAELGREIYGGRLANFIGNRISWKLAKGLQLLKTQLPL